MKLEIRDINTILDCYYSCVCEDPSIPKISTKRDNPDNYQKISPLARGSYGDVFIVKHKETSKLYAMKRLNKEKIKKHPNTALFLYERDCLIDCRDLVYSASLISSFQDMAYLYFIMNFYEGGDLLSVLARLDVLPEKHILFYTAELILALEELHSKFYIHRDIKPDNILITTKGHIKLADFGSCARVDEETLTVESCHPVGTPDYISPEVLNSTNSINSYGFEVDVWSLGVVVYEMLNGNTPFYGTSLSETYKKIRRIDFQNVNGSLSLRNFIEHMICPKEKRYSIQQLKKELVDIFEIDFNNLVPPFIPEADWNVNFGDIGFKDDDEILNVGYKGFIGFSYDDNAEITNIKLMNDNKNKGSNRKKIIKSENDFKNTNEENNNQGDAISYKHSKFDHISNFNGSTNKNKDEKIQVTAVKDNNIVNCDKIEFLNKNNDDSYIVNRITSEELNIETIERKTENKNPYSITNSTKNGNIEENIDSVYNTTTNKNHFSNASIENDNSIRIEIKNEDRCANNDNENIIQEEKQNTTESNFKDGLENNFQKCSKNKKDITKSIESMKLSNTEFHIVNNENQCYAFELKKTFQSYSTEKNETKNNSMHSPIQNIKQSNIENDIADSRENIEKNNEYQANENKKLDKKTFNNVCICNSSTKKLISEKEKFENMILKVKTRESLWRLKMYVDQVSNQYDFCTSISEQLIRENKLLKKEIRKKESQIDIGTLKKVEAIKKELRQAKMEVREQQQKQEMDALQSKKLQDEIQYLKEKLEESGKLIRSFSSLKNDSKKEFVIKILDFETDDLKNRNYEIKETKLILNEDSLTIKNEKTDLINIYQSDLKENELYFLSEKKRNLVVKIVILESNRKSNTTISSCKSNEELAGELIKEERILAGIENMLKLIPKNSQHYNDAEKQKIGTLKKIEQIKRDMGDKSKTGSIISNLGNEKRGKENEEKYLQSSKQSRVLEFNNHQFIKKTFIGDKTCSHCNNFLCGTQDQGLECCDCKMIVHNWCYILVEESCELYKQIKVGKTHFFIMKSLEEKEKLTKILKLY